MAIALNSSSFHLWSVSDGAEKKLGEREVTSLISRTRNLETKQVPLKTFPKTQIYLMQLLLSNFK